LDAVMMHWPLIGYNQLERPLWQHMIFLMEQALSLVIFWTKISGKAAHETTHPRHN
jgi:hypothetical protein